MAMSIAHELEAPSYELTGGGYVGGKIHDFAKAFDVIPHSIMFHCLEKRGISPRVLVSETCMALDFIRGPKNCMKSRSLGLLCANFSRKGYHASLMASSCSLTLPSGSRIVVAKFVPVAFIH